MGKKELLEQWDQQRNLPLTPDQVSYGSKKRAWWRCERGHLWQTAVYARTGSAAGCPYCAGRRALPGIGDLASRFPDVARQWHPEKNGSLTPGQVLPGSHRTVWWRCDKGHEWRAQVKSRAEGSGCPVCAGRKIVPGENDLASRFPILAAQWHSEKNGKLTPQEVTPGSRRKVWWKCDKGHVWKAAVSSRALGGSGCPVCTGRKVVPGENDLVSRFPLIAAQWDAVKNQELTPQSVSPYSNRRVWWRCGKGHSYRASVASRTMRGSGCPVCAGRQVLPGFNDLASRFPDLAEQWHPVLNGNLTPEMVTPGSHKKVWWQCGQGHVWRAVIYSRTGQRRTGCPVCAGTAGTI